jgi:hypothetical protein
MPRNAYRTPNVNASLLHEFRMIAEQILQFRPKAKSHHSSGLKCAFCITIRKDKPNDALTVINGQSVCHDHMYYMQDSNAGPYIRIKTIITRDEVKR